MVGRYQRSRNAPADGNGCAGDLNASISHAGDLNASISHAGHVHASFRNTRSTNGDALAYRYRSIHCRLEY